NGEDPDNIGGIIMHVLKVLGAEVLEFVPMMLSVLAIVLAYNLISSIRGKFASESIEKVVYFATGLVAVCLVVGYFSSVLATAVKFVVSVKTQINAVAPVMITLMTAAGASSSAGVYTPSVALLGAGMVNAITYVVFPMILMGLVFDIIGSVSSSVKLDKASDFFRSCCKWFMGTSFFLFTTMLGVSGITASVKDGISIKAARFAVSKYVPVIGGYLSQGFDYIMAGNVLIKNAVGASAIVLVILTAAPVICRLVVFSLTLKLTAAICEPLGGEKFSGVLSAIGKSASLVTTAVVAMTFLYVLFLIMIISTGNVAL
ncbi:MAG: stage III sporulation protein AE, partial [Clostridiales bacterium]|nr:stage III sporulation protein AE [Clostridiales bacterium]